MDASTLFYQQGLSLHNKGLLTQAYQAYLQAIQINPRNSAAQHALGVVDSKNGDASKGLKRFEKALAIDPHNPVYLSNCGSALISLARFTDALKVCVNALSIQPNYFSALRNCGIALISLERHQEAMSFLDKAIHIQPDAIDVLLLRARSLHEIKAYVAAIASCDQIIQKKPDYVEAYFLKGSTLSAAKRYSDAIVCYDQALSIKPQSAMVLFHRGAAYEYDRNYPEAIDSYTQALHIDASIPYGKGSLLHSKMLCCDWQGLDDLHTEIKQHISQGKKSAMPFGYQAIANDEASLQKCAQLFANDKHPLHRNSFSHPSWNKNTKIKLGYLCGEFREQATSILMTEIWELHDKSTFELFAFDNGWDDGSPRRKRINKAFDHVIDIRPLSDSQAAQLIYEQQIDILVNLNGFFGLDRNNIFARKPSPIQVNYLGFPGTMGVSYMDYMIADPFVIPEQCKHYYNEQVIHLESCYQPNDSKRIVSERKFTRPELGLPENGFVFCCFNNSYKITPDTFDVWMRILRQVENSVIWLLEDTVAAVENLKNEAILRGINSNRLVFAPRIPNDEHLARHAMADLFLDTWPYNAHTTASDALWADLPVLTLKGQTFPGRVGSSLLTNLLLQELVAESTESYQTIAVRLATNPAMLSDIRQKLMQSKTSHAPFNSLKHTAALENIFSNLFNATS